LKTKGRKRAFSPAKAENILKKRQLEETVGTPKEHDKMTTGRDSLRQVAGGGKGLM
jgi:hypothetical protein